jgi:hypothetical protein
MLAARLQRLMCPPADAPPAALEVFRLEDAVALVRAMEPLRGDVYARAKYLERKRTALVLNDPPPPRIPKYERPFVGIRLRVPAAAVLVHAPGAPAARRAVAPSARRDFMNALIRPDPTAALVAAVGLDRLDQLNVALVAEVYGGAKTAWRMPAEGAALSGAGEASEQTNRVVQQVIRALASLVVTMVRNRAALETADEPARRRRPRQRLLETGAFYTLAAAVAQQPRWLLQQDSTKAALQRHLPDLFAAACADPWAPPTPASGS